MKMKLKDVKVNEYFTLKDYGEKDVPEKAVWCKGNYDRSSRTYSCIKFYDVNRESFFKGTREVFTDLTF